MGVEQVLISKYNILNWLLHVNLRCRIREGIHTSLFFHLAVESLSRINSLLSVMLRAPGLLKFYNEYLKLFLVPNFFFLVSI